MCVCVCSCSLDLAVTEASPCQQRVCMYRVALKLSCVYVCRYDVLERNDVMFTAVHTKTMGIMTVLVSQPIHASTCVSVRAVRGMAAHVCACACVRRGCVAGGFMLAHHAGRQCKRKNVCVCVRMCVYVCLCVFVSVC